MGRYSESNVKETTRVEPVRALSGETGGYQLSHEGHELHKGESAHLMVLRVAGGQQRDPEWPWCAADPGGQGDADPS